MMGIQAMKRSMNLYPSLLVVLAVLSFALGGCGQGGSDNGTGGDNQRVVGFSQIGAESSWRTAETKSIRSEAEKRGVDLRFSDAQGKQENQVKALNAFIAQGVDAIILAPVVETGWEPVLKKAKQRNIPVILVDRGVEVTDDSLYTTLVASDFVAEGRMAAEWLAEYTGGKANIVELQGTPGASAAIDRKEGFEQVIAQYPEMKIIKSQTGDFNRAKGKEVMEAFLKSDDDDEIDAVYAHNDDMALGAIQAIEENGKTPGEDIILVSIDGVKGAFEAMVAGELNATVECNPLLGPMAFDAVEKAIAGEDMPKWLVVEDNVYDRSVAADMIDSREY